MAEFFEAGRVYRHFEGGLPSGLGVFVVVWAGRAPAGFELPEQAGGVAFGWRRTAPTAAVDEGCPAGAHWACDFTGWREVTNGELAVLLPSPIPVEAWSPHHRRRNGAPP
nr:hypothetical protein [Streptomyces sp. TLI_235]